MSDVLLRALLGGITLAIMLGPLGAFVVWRQMAYFGDTIAHSALLGVALSLAAGDVVPMPLSIFFVAVSVAFILSRYSRDQRFQTDTMLGILAHSALAFGVLFVAMTENVRTDLNAYLFGDILGVSWQEVGILAALACVILILIAYFWRRLLMATIEPNIAAVEGVNVMRMQLLLTVLLSAVIAVSIKLTGVLLITSLLIIPAATARYFSASPKHMAVLSCFMGVLAVTGGLFTSLQFDSPTGPTIVVCAALLFAFCGLVGRRQT